MSQHRSILMIHGLNDTGKVFNTMVNYLQQQNFPTHTLDLKPNSGTADLRELAQQVRAYIENNFPPEEKINLIGFSMGGLITRYYLQRLNGITKTNKYVSISAPNYGSNWAYLLPFTGIKQMRPHSHFLQDLNTDVKQQLNTIPCLTIWTPVDTMIIPAHSSLMGVGKEISIPLQIHKFMLRDQRVLQNISQFFRI